MSLLLLFHGGVGVPTIEPVLLGGVFVEIEPFTGPAPLTLASMRAQVRHRLNDRDGIWTNAEINDYLRQGYRDLAHTTRCFWDVVYAENLPATFSYTADWELPYVEFDAGMANYTCDDERRLLTELQRVGPARSTSPFQALDGWQVDSIPATSVLPERLVAIDRALWDHTVIEPTTPSRLQERDSRYQTTEGEVYAYTEQQDGIRTLRKIRKPAAAAMVYAHEGSWGIPRDVSDVSDSGVTGTWGIARQIPTQHPLGTEHWGTPRRFFHDGLNVRVEHFREGRALEAETDLCELPDRYVIYVRDFALAMCYARHGRGRQAALAAHYRQRYVRGIARLQRRMQHAITARARQLGGSTPRRHGPPRPSRPWQFGAEVR